MTDDQAIFEVVRASSPDRVMSLEECLAWHNAENARMAAELMHAMTEFIEGQQAQFERDANELTSH